MEIDWGFWIGQGLWTLVLAAVGAALFEWAVKPLVSNIFGPEHRLRRTHAWQDKVFIGAAELGSRYLIFQLFSRAVVSTFLSIFLIVIGLSVISLYVSYTESSGSESINIGSDLVYVGLDLAWLSIFINIAFPIILGAYLYAVSRYFQYIRQVLSVEHSFGRTLEFLSAFVERHEILRLKSEYSRMRGREDAVKISNRLRELGEHSGHPVPWAQDFIS